MNGFWADAAARHGRDDLFIGELLGLAEKAVRDAQFTEIYHPLTGAIYGGRQESWNGGEIVEWDSCRRQTWSATAFLRMVLHGLLGLRFEHDAAIFQPCLPEPLTAFSLRGLPYRGAQWNVEVSGTGARIGSFLVNGQPRSTARIEAGETGTLEIRIGLTR